METYEEEFIPPGSLVRRDALWDDETEATSEYGIVTHCWWEETLSYYDCRIDFFGTEWPADVEAVKPYRLRYAASSLVVLYRFEPSQ